jgi:putative hydrolase of the HAD superfamily
MHTHALLLDVGKVIADFDHLKSCAWIGSKTGHSTEWIRGQLFSPHGPAHRHEEGMSTQQFFDEVCAITGLETDFESFKKAWGKIFTQTPDIYRILGHIEPHVRLGLVTNTDPIHWNEISALPVMMEHFPWGVNAFTSFQFRMRKPDERLYRHAVHALCVSIDQTLYIDDNEQYVQTFRNMGGKAEVYNCEAHKPLRLERILKHHGYMK